MVGSVGLLDDQGVTTCMKCDFVVVVACCEKYVKREAKGGCRNFSLRCVRAILLRTMQLSRNAQAMWMTALVIGDQRDQILQHAIKEEESYVQVLINHTYGRRM